MRRAQRGCGGRDEDASGEVRHTASEEAHTGVACVDEAACSSRGGRRAKRRLTEEVRGEETNEREARDLGWHSSMVRRRRGSTVRRCAARMREAGGGGQGA
jgi:hypothetical protein